MHEFGGPEVLEVVEVPRPEAGENEVLIHVSRAGLNYADTHQRTNSYLAPAEVPMIPGAEVAGVREGTGDRVVALVGSGGYAEYVKAPADLTFPIPDGVDDGTAVALLLQGLTAFHLFVTSARLSRGETVVVHAAAGGVGSLAVQLAEPLGAGRVIGTASSEEKRALVLELGADAAVDSDPDGLRERLVEANDGRKVDVVLEMAGGKAFEQSLAALAPFGRLVTYGIASQEANQVSTADLMRRSQGVIGFWLMHCIGKPGMVDEALADLFARTQDGNLRVVVGATYPLAEAGQAHRDLQARRSHGKLLLDPAA